ncbi:MAG: KUP/HAK/KT family potassium transporter [Candidatus Nanopelagicales bacterium]|nr:KUP/HAK/KT family potassium transporter [Candidatus Nanopelagicales bacterium]
MAAIGIVFGDIGTSPLYSVQQIFSGAHTIAPDPPRVLGAMSLIFWTVTLIVSVKYVLVVMRADNDGEGGIMALASLTVLHPFKTARRRMVLLGLGVFGAALFYGDSMITPAVSVLSAVEGLAVFESGLQPLVVPLALVVLVTLFAVQRFGTARVGAVFGPIMVVWFVVIGALGVASIIGTPSVLSSIAPSNAVSLFVDEPLVGFLALSSVILCVTGVEALYADLGHFGTGPIRISWFGLVSWALYLNYMGQGALLLRDPGAAANPFYELAPDVLQIPLVVLATVATVIASQAVISGAFSMTDQAIKLRFLPRMTVVHTSAQTRGQIFVPFINGLLLISILALVVGFRSSSNLASAYGLAVSGTFVITTVLICVVARTRWRVHWALLVPVAAFFLAIELAFVASNLTKFSHGAWVPVLVAIVVAAVLTTWARGRTLLRDQMNKYSMSNAELATAFAESEAARTQGTAVYLTIDQRPPLALTEHFHLGRTTRNLTVQVAIETARVPVVAEEDRVDVEMVCPGFARVVSRHGFIEKIDIGRDLRAAQAKGLQVQDPVIYVVHTSRVEPHGRQGMALWRKHLFAFMSRNAADPASAFRLEDEDVVEYASVVPI